MIAAAARQQCGSQEGRGQERECPGLGHGRRGHPGEAIPAGIQRIECHRDWRERAREAENAPRATRRKGGQRSRIEVLQKRDDSGAGIETNGEP